jgi:hypothetical protein
LSSETATAGQVTYGRELLDIVSNPELTQRGHLSRHEASRSCKLPYSLSRDPEPSGNL